MADAPKPFAVLYPGDGAPDNAALRCLGEAGVPVAVVSARRLNANAVSRYCRRAFHVPSVESGSAAVIDRMIDVARELGSEPGREPVLFMLHDFAVMLASKHRDRLSEHYRSHFLSEDVLEVCNQHDRTCAAASAAGVAAPATLLWPGATDEQLDRIPKPCVIKPVSKYTVNAGEVCLEPFLRRFGRKAFKANSRRELESFLGRSADAGVSVVVQEYVPGGIRDLVTVVLYVARGQVLAHCAGRKLRQAPPDCGTCTYGESCADADEAVELAARLVGAIGYDGIAEVEFKRDARDGRLKLMELNPRATVFCLMGRAQGVNLPLAAYEHLTNGAMCSSPKPKGRTVVRWMDPYRDLLQSGRTDGAGRVSLLRWFHELRKADLLNWGGRKDLLPLLVAPVQGVLEWLDDKLKRVRPRALRPVKGTGDAGYVDYWQRRSQRRGLSSVMWSVEDYNVLADGRQKALLDSVLGGLAGQKALDLGCGTGRLSIYLARKGAEVVGVDLPCMTEAAQKANPHPRVSYVGTRADSMEFPAGAFDVILSVGALAVCLCDTPEKLDGMIARLRDLLRPGGTLILMEPFHACPGLRRSLHMSPGAALGHFTRGGLRLTRRESLLFLPFRMALSKVWWPGPRAVTSCLFKFGEALLRVPGVGWLSDYKMFVLLKEQP